MTTQLTLIRDATGLNTYGTPLSDKNYGSLLSVGSDDTVTAPTDSGSNYLAVIRSNPGASIWVSVNDTAEAPSSSFSSSTSRLNPPSIKVNSGDILSLITTDDTAYVNVEFFSGTT